MKSKEKVDLICPKRTTFSCPGSWRARRINGAPDPNHELDGGRVKDSEQMDVMWGEVLESLGLVSAAR